MDQLGKLLPRFFNKHVRGDRPPVLEVLSPLWPRVAGKAMAAQSRPVAFGNGTLTVAAFNAPWATELRGLHHEIRTAVNRTLGRPLVKRVRVKLASASDYHVGPDGKYVDAVAYRAPADEQDFRTSESKAAATRTSVEETELALRSALDPEVREVLLRSFAKYFGRSNRMVN